MYLSIMVMNEIIIVPWTIILQENDISFSALFLQVQSGAIANIVPTQYLTQCSLVKVLVGQSHSKDCVFNIVETSHSVLGVCSIFGSFIKFLVTVFTGEALEVQVSREARHADSRRFPLAITEKNRKDKLYNSLVQFCIDHNYSWEDPDVYGKPFLTSLCDTLWYIDGHHDIFSSRSCSIPVIFSSFTGFNRPELSKHRKRSISNMHRDRLLELATVLQEHAISSWIEQPQWVTFKQSLLTLVESLSSYASYLAVRNKSMKVHHSSTTPSVSFSDASTVQYLSRTVSISPLLTHLDTTVANSSMYQIINVNDFSPKESRPRYLFIRELEKGLSSPVFFLKYTHGSNVGNYYFVWKAPEHVSQEACWVENARLVEEIKKEIPVFHTRAMRQEFFNLVGRVSPKSKPFVLRSIYRTLTNDDSGSRTTAECEIDKRAAEALSMEDPNIVVDLRELNTNGSDRYTVFWEKCSQYLAECTAVHERRHGTTVFMAKAISIRDLIEQVEKLCPDGSPIPSNSWVQLNFCPRNPRSSAARRYTGRLAAKHMVQKRMFRKYHPDSHYCSAIFRYMRDYAIKYRDISSFICIDDKHSIKVGEPGFPVAAVERGREVIVSSHEVFLVGDHDFTKFKITPSVALLVDIPLSIEESWYTGEVLVGLKESVFEPSSPIRHATELYNSLLPKMENRHILFIYSDGGPDHRLTFLSVQLSLIALFLNLDLDILIAGRTAPSHSWANPVERVMSIINLGLQCVGIMRGSGSDTFEDNVSKCNNVKELREGCSLFKEEIRESLRQPKELIASILIRLELKGKKFNVFQSASQQEIQEFWNVLLTIDSSLTKYHTTQKSIEKLQELQLFLKHCCEFKKYYLTIKKCGKEYCKICKPVKMSLEIFAGIHNLPKPILNEDGHYSHFCDVYGTIEPERKEDTPPPKNKKSLPFNATQQHVKNVNVVVQCEECQMWRLLFSKKKLSPSLVTLLQQILEELSYTCGSSFDDVELPAGMESVCVRTHSCNEPMEKLYYSCGFTPICIYCAGEINELEDSDYYPQCHQCSRKERIKKITRKKKD